MNKKFSSSAIFLMILLAIRIIGEIYLVFIYSPLFGEFIGILLMGITFLTIIFYLVALVGVFKRTKWGLNFALAIAILDILLGIALGLIYGFAAGTFGGFIVDIIIILLVTNISKRINKRK